MKKTVINMPLHLSLSDRKGAKKYHINLNNYRNWYYRASNNIKIKYKEIASQFLEDLVFSTPIKLEFKLFPPNKRIRDRANVLSVHEKFFCDAMVELGCIPDDNDEYIISTLYHSGELDRKNGRVEITIIELDN